MARPKGAKNKDLTPKQALFIEYYCTPQTELFGNAYKSYKNAFNPIKSSKETIMSSACNLLKNVKIIQAISLYRPHIIGKQAKNAEIRKEYALTKHQELYDRCFIDHDNTSCVALLRMYWQGAGLLSERLVIDVHDSRKLDIEFQKEAKRIASIVLESTELPDHVIEAPEFKQLNSGFNTLSEQFTEPPDAIETPQDTVLSEPEPMAITTTDFLSDD